jgi:ATP-binding cassette, subfamily B, bacterial
VVALPSSKKTYLDPRNLPRVESTTIRRILSYLRPHAAQASLVLGAILASALLNLLPPIFAKRIVDQAIPTGDTTLLVLLCLGMVAGPVVASLFGVLEKYMAAVMGERVMFGLRVDLFKHLHDQPLGYFATSRPGEALSRVLNDVQGVGQVVSKTLVEVVDKALIFTTTLILLLFLDWRLALAAILFLPFFILPSRSVGRRRKELKRTTQERMADMVSLLAETLSISGALLLKVFGTEKQERKRLEKTAQEVMDLSLKQTLIGRWLQVVLGFLEAMGPAIVFLVGGLLVMKSDMKLGTLVAAVTLLRRLFNPARELANVHVDVVTSYAYFDRVFAVLDLQPAIRDNPDARQLTEVKGSLRFEDVTFAYNTEPVLERLTLDIPAGQCVAIVGPSGSGKSTIAALVARLYDPTEGRILLDGNDLREVTLASLRSHIGIVTQETFLFHASILDNLRYGRTDATAEQVQEAARAAQIHDMIAALPDGYDTMVGERGYMLSGGERQRVAIARAILRNPRVLILDEATSALDSQNEALIQRALDPLLRGRTSLVISHRLSTIRKADVILYVEEGQIRERGRHEELMARGGLYAKLHRQQFSVE